MRAKLREVLKKNWKNKAMHGNAYGIFFFFHTQFKEHVHD
jgi:hypothetical protein